MFEWCGNGVVEGDWTDVDVELKVARSLVSCFWETEEEEDETGAHEDGKEVEGPLPAKRIAGCYETD